MAVSRGDTRLSSMTPPREEPVFNTFKRKVYRPFFSLREFQIGLACLVVLVATLAWVLYRAQRLLAMVAEAYLRWSTSTIAGRSAN